MQRAENFPGDTVWRTRSLILAGAFTLYRLAVMGTTGLGDSESYYWTWSRHMDLSYYDHPPLVAWLIRLSTAIHGDTPFWVRFPSAIIFVGVCWLIYKTAYDIFGSRETGFWALLLFNITPLFAFGALQMVPDIPAAFFWMLFVNLAAKAVREDKPLLWYPAGLAIGVGLLGKYMLAPLVPSTLLMLGFHPALRHHLKKPHIYLGGVLGLAAFAPVIAWNMLNDFPSFKFHLVDRNVEEHFGWSHCGQFLGGQGVYMSPLIWLGLLYVAYRAGKSLFAERDARFAPLFWLGVPPLIFFYYIGLWSRTSEPHWSAFAYLTLYIAWGHYLATRRQQWKKFSFAAIGLSAALVAAAYIHVFYPILPLKPKYDIINELYGWPEVGKAVEQEYAALPGAHGKFVMAHHWVMCSQLAFATRNKLPVNCLNGTTDQFDFFPDKIPPTGADFIFVADNRFEEPPDAFYLFDRAELAKEITTNRGGIPVRQFTLYRVYGYRGQK